MGARLTKTEHESQICYKTSDVYLATVLLAHPESVFLAIASVIRNSPRGGYRTFFFFAGDHCPQIAVDHANGSLKLPTRELLSAFSQIKNLSHDAAVVLTEQEERVLSHHIARSPHGN